MDILKIILTIIFVIDCIAQRSAEPPTHTGDRTKDVLWRERL